MENGTIIKSASGERYVLTGPLGAGATSDVYSALRIRDNVTVAIKFLRSRDYITQVHFQRELWAYREFHGCPFVVDLLDNDLAAQRPYLVLEFCSYGSARQNLGYLNSNQKMTLALLTHLATSLEVVQQRGCIYRDLKPENLLLTKDGAGNMIMKLGDAGLICLPGEFGQFVATRTPAGTLPYMAPELFKQGAIYTREAEIFALGVTAHELLTGQRPGAGAMITTGPTETQGLIGRMIAIDPRERPTIADVRAGILQAHKLLVDRDQTVLAILCGGLLALGIAAVLKGKK
jgi:serine/threonine protein kinase